MKTVSLTVRRKYFDAIVAGTKKEEIRANIPRWQWLLEDPPDQVVFLCGRDQHCRRVTRIYRAHPHIVLGRHVSEQGVKDLGLLSSSPEDSQLCIVIELGDEVIGMKVEDCMDCEHYEVKKVGTHNKNLYYCKLAENRINRVDVCPKVMCPKCRKNDKLSIATDHLLYDLEGRIVGKVYVCDRCKLLFGWPP